MSTNPILNQACQDTEALIQGYLDALHTNESVSTADLIEFYENMQSKMWSVAYDLNKSLKDAGRSGVRR